MNVKRRIMIGSVLLIGLCLLSPVAWSATGTTVSYASGDETVEGYLAVPDGQGPFPAIIVIHEWWGLNDWIRQNAMKLADQGYVTLAIDLYRGQVTTSAAEAHGLMYDTAGDRATRDLSAAVAYIKSRPDVRKNRIGAVGWNMGGGYSLMMALSVPDFAGCVIIYGNLVTEPATIKKIPCPVLGIFGENDRGIPTRSVLAFEKACRAAGKIVEIHLYPGAGHAFMNENNPRGYNADAAKDAWDRIYSFLERALKR